MAASRVPRVLVAVACLAAFGGASPAAAVRVTTYNVLNFPGSTGTQREPSFRAVLEGVNPDILVSQEMLSQAGVDQFLGNVLNTLWPGEFAAVAFTNGPDTDNVCFYRPAVVEFISTRQIHTTLRDISEYVFRSLGSSSAGGEIRLYSFHLKAGSSGSDEAQRLAEATILRDELNALPAGSNFAALGDFNIRAATEAAYQKLVGSEADDDGRLFDPIDTPGTWYNNPAFVTIHTQSPRTDAFGGGATGGMDDRFDQILVSASLLDGEGWDVIAGTYTPYGNDGNHFNLSINAGANTAVPQAVADAIHDAADHCPVYADFMVPAEISAPVALDFGTVPVGAVVELTLEIENTALVPGDTLEYSLSAPTGFLADLGPHAVLAGAGAGEHAIALDTSQPAVYSANLVVSSSDLDQASWNVLLTATVQATTAVAEAAPPAAARLLPARPNPFNPSTTLRYQVPAGGARVRLSVHDLSGAEVARLAEGWVSSGLHEARWTGVDGAGQPAASGLYLIRLQAGEAVEVGKALLVR